MGLSIFRYSVEPQISSIWPSIFIVFFENSTFAWGSIGTVFSTVVFLFALSSPTLRSKKVVTVVFLFLLRDIFAVYSIFSPHSYDEVAVWSSSWGAFMLKPFVSSVECIGVFNSILLFPEFLISKILLSPSAPDLVTTISGLSKILIASGLSSILIS